jgi:hypothetical protein
LQLKDGKEKEDCENENLSDCDCDKTIEVHRNTIEGKIIRKQRKSIVKNLEIDEVNEDLIQIEVKKNLVNEKNREIANKEVSVRETKKKSDK